MIVGYGRTSTVDQVAGLDAQVRDLKAAGCERIWQEHVSSVAERPELNAALDFVREGDTFMVTKFDRLARNVPELCRIATALTEKKVALRVLGAAGIDTSTATGRLMMQMLGSVAEFERAMMLERQREGIAAARELGKYKGRKPTVQMQRDRIIELHATGISNGAIARELRVHRSNVGRVLAAEVRSTVQFEGLRS
jgi:DNA invertase Pin-like site-specific DNA recombinase